MAESHDSLVEQFCSLSGAPSETAREYLEFHSWDVRPAITDYLQHQEDEADEVHRGATITGPRTLDGRPAPPLAAQAGPVASSSRPKRQKKTGLATMASIRKSAKDHSEGDGNGHGHDHGSEDSDEDSSEEADGRPRDLFAGGEKSGLAVQDPHSQGGHKKIVRDLITKATENSGRNELAARSSRPTVFGGAGRMLGRGEGDGDAAAAAAASSSSVPTATSGQQPGGASQRTRQTSQPTREFVLHLWEDGFSIDDGELHRFDNAANRADLETIRAGRAPPGLLNVRPDEPVDVRLETHGGKWKPMAKKYKPFDGEGRRLGTILSDAGGSTVSSTGVAAAASISSADATASSGPPPIPSLSVDSSQPVVAIRIQLPDGTRLPARFNTTHTVGDLYNFIRGSSIELSAGGRSWVLATTFPNKDHTDKTACLGDVSEFKRGGAAVVKWL